jgi:hypothetical protein
MTTEPDYKPVYKFSRFLWIVLAIVCMISNFPDLATMFFAGAIYCRFMEVTS